MSDEQKIGYVFNLVTGLDEAQQLTISGNLVYGATADEMGVEFDKLLAVTSRLAARHKADKKRAEIADGEAILNSMKQDMAQLDGSKDAAKLNTAERNNREAMVRNIRHMEGKIAGLRDEHAALLKIAE